MWARSASRSRNRMAVSHPSTVRPPFISRNPTGISNAGRATCHEASRRRSRCLHCPCTPSSARPDRGGSKGDQKVRQSLEQNYQNSSCYCCRSQRIREICLVEDWQQHWRQGHRGWQADVGAYRAEDTRVCLWGDWVSLESEGDSCVRCVPLNTGLMIR